MPSTLSTLTKQAIARVRRHTPQSSVDNVRGAQFAPQVPGKSEKRKQFGQSLVPEVSVNRSGRQDSEGFLSMCFPNKSLAEPSLAVEYAPNLLQYLAVRPRVVDFFRTTKL